MVSPPEVDLCMSPVSILEPDYLGSLYLNKSFAHESG